MFVPATFLEVRFAEDHPRCQLSHLRRIAIVLCCLCAAAGSSRGRSTSFRDADRTLAHWFHCKE